PKPGPRWTTPGNWTDQVPKTKKNRLARPVFFSRHGAAASVNLQLLFARVTEMKVLFCLPLIGALLSGCAMFRDSNDPAKDKQYVVVVNSLTWTNPVSGKKDGTRTVWPLVQLANHEEVFPLAQIKHCPEGLPCAWGVLSAARNITRYKYEPGGITLDIGLDV